MIEAIDRTNSSPGGASGRRLPRSRRVIGVSVEREHATRRLAVLLACLFVATVGFGITLPVLPFYAERLARSGGASARDVAIQVGLLTAVYPLAQLFFAPLWGRLSDTLGRKRLVVVGIAGAAIGQTLFAFAGSLAALYGARALGGLLTAALFPAAAAYVADATTRDARARGMAWLGTAVSLGAVVGPGLGGLLARASWELRGASGRTLIPSFAVPFLAAAALGFVALTAVLAWLPESRPAAAAPRASDPASGDAGAAGSARPGGASHPRIALRPLLVLAVAGQFGLALFEGTFALYAKRMWNYGPTEIGTAFVVCGLVMALAQAGAMPALSRRVGELAQVAIGFGMVGASLALLPAGSGSAAVLLTIAVLALGLALIAPNLAALIATRSSHRRTGSALGAQSAANSLGQVIGTLVGGALLAWQMEAPYFLSAAVLLGLGAAIGWRVASARRAVTE